MGLFIKKKEMPEKTILRVFGIKFVYNKKKAKFLDLYNRNRMYNFIVDNLCSIPVKRGILEDRFFKMVGYFPNFDNPQSFNEKLNWLKLYYHDELQCKCVDKITFKDYIREVLGAEYVIATLAVYDRAEDIDFDSLPDKFVIKSNCGWGGLQVIVVKDKRTVDIDRIKAQVNTWLATWNNYYYQSFEWNYKGVTPKILVEEYLEGIDGDVPDYKFLCYNGEPKNLFIVSNRSKKMSVDFFDMNWNLLPFIRKYPNSRKLPLKPKSFEKMREIAKKLSQPFPFVRVDLYDVNGKIYVGELTFMPGGGVEPFTPREWDYKLGSMLQLPKEK